MELSHRQLKTIDLLGIDIRKKTGKGWISGVVCPSCGKSEKFGIKFNQEVDRKSHVSFNCFRGSCQFHGSEYDLFKLFNKLHILYEGEFIGSKEQVDAQLKLLEDVMPDISVPIRHLPFGFKRTYDNTYLNGRGYLPYQYETNVIGTTRLLSKLRDYVLFLCYEDGENRGYVSRLMLSKEEIDRIEQKTGFKTPKYLNEAVDFGKMLYGIDEITENTKEVILVEGITDKHNVDRLLQLHLSEEVKCIACFGKKVSQEQILKLWSKGKNVTKIILLFDANTINSSKTYSRALSIWFSEIKLAFLDNEEVDPGNIEKEELNHVLSNLHSPDQYDVNFCEIGKII